MEDASFMISELHQRKREADALNSRGGPANQQESDPFSLLKDVVHLSNIKNLAKDQSELTNEQAMSKAGYHSMISEVASKSLTSIGGEGFKLGYDPASIEEKIKRLKFVSHSHTNSMNKDIDWFSKISGGTTELVRKPTMLKNGMNTD